MAVDRDFCLSVLQHLVRIDSVNPSLVPGARGEAEIGEYVAGLLSDIGLEAERHEPVPGRVSVTGRLPGSGGGRSLMLNGHYDTVGIDGMKEPFSAAVREGRLYGRGAFDMKGAVAACITAAKALADQGTPLAGDVLVAAVADEEYGSVGTADLAARLKIDGAIVTEPTGLRVCLAHKGYQWIRVETEGRAAHGSRVDLGVDANLRMGRVLARLAGLEQELRQRTPHPLVGPPSLHAALLQGGSGLSTYAAECTLQIERRTIPGETEASVMAEIAGILDALRGEDPEFRASVEAFFVREPFEVSPGAPVVAARAAPAPPTRGAAPAPNRATPGMDAALLAAAGTETVVFGPTGAGAHADEEWVDLESVYQTAEVLVETARRYCVV